MADRLTTATATMALVAAGAVLCAGLPAGALTPTPTPSTTSSGTPSASAAPTAGATPATPAPSATTTAAAPSAAPAARPSATATVRARARTVATPLPTASASPTATPAPVAPMPVPTPTPSPTPLVPPPVATALSTAQGHVSKSRTVTMTGSQLTNLRAVRIGGVLATGLVVLSPTSARFVVPNAVDYQAKVAPVTLTALADGITRPTTLAFTYVVKGKVDRQLSYAFQNWNAFSNATFGYIAGNDCMNFASQTLLSRGWKESPEWFNDGPGRWSSTWVSSTAFSTWLKTRPDLATRLPYRERDQVAVGDVIQFRWPGHRKGYAAWDHTGIVSKVVVLPNGRHDVYYTSHTLNRQYGGSTQALATYMAKDLRIQFFKLV